MKLLITPTVVLFLSAILFGITGCNKNEVTTPEKETIQHVIPILVNIESLLSQAKPGDEVTKHVTMFKSNEAYHLQQEGDANLNIEVTPGDEVIWKFIPNEEHECTITEFIFELKQGENFFTQTGGWLPIQQEDGTWKAKVSPQALDGSTLKYSIYFTLDGKNYWWDPLISNRSNP
jgi:plastocyanin